MMKLLSLLSFISSALAVQVHRNQFRSKGFTFDYSKHGQDWTQGVCSSRDRQSPVDFTSSMLAQPATGKIAFSYVPVESSFEVSNTGHVISADFQGLGYGGITYENNWYNLMSVNFHTLSEHTFNGTHQPLEMHMVHKRYDSDALLVVAIPFTGGSVPAMAAVAGSAAAGSAAAAAAPAAPAGAIYEAPKDGFPMLNRFLSAAPPAVNQKAVAHCDSINILDLNKFMEGGQFFEYAGSLTAPPCAEVTTWFVRKDFVVASQKQIDVLYNSLMSLSADFGNYRSVMPLNGRPVAVRLAVKEEPVQQMPPPAVALGPNPQTDREYRALKWSRDALKTAKSATDYVRDLDQRLRAAAEAHAAAMTPGSAAPQPPAAAAPAATGPVLDPAAVGPPPTPEMQNVAAQAGAAISAATGKAVAAATSEIAAAASAAATAAAATTTTIATPVAAAR